MKKNIKLVSRKIRLGTICMLSPAAIVFVRQGNQLKVEKIFEFLPQSRIKMTSL